MKPGKSDFVVRYQETDYSSSASDFGEDQKKVDDSAFKLPKVEPAAQAMTARQVYKNLPIIKSNDDNRLKGISP